MSALSPCLRPDLSIFGQSFQGETSYVVKDIRTQRYFRVGTLERAVMRYFDGRHTVGEIVDALTAAGMRVSVPGIEAFARTLDQAGFLERTIAQRAVLQLERLREDRLRPRRFRLLRGELLRLRWSFGDPDFVLSRLLPRVRWIFTTGFVAASVALFAIYLGLFALNWDRFWFELGASYLPANITLETIITLWVTAGAVILVHELGHAFTCKNFGGDVREFGFMLLYFQPAFYCNVSDAWTFPDLRARLWVTAAGSWIQMVLASLAALTWIAAAPGTLLANVSLAVMMMGGVTTLLTNMNPLLPLDGYFALSDWLEIPNLRQRSLLHYRWWLQRRVLGLEAPEPAATPRERRIFLTYGVLAGAYGALILTLVATIALLWARQILGASGVAVTLIVAVMLGRSWIAEWSRAAALALRARRAIWRESRWRWRSVIAVAALLLVGLLPWTITSSGRFLVQPITSRTVTAPADGILAAVFVAEGTWVEAGAPVAQLVDRALDHLLLTETRVVDSLALAELRARAAGHTAETEHLENARHSALALHAALVSRRQRLTLRAAMAGVVATPRPDRLTGRRVHPGDSLFTIAALDSFEVRVALRGAGATRVRPGQVVHLFAYADDARPFASVVTDVSASVGEPERRGGVVEARIALPFSVQWRPGHTGEASVELERSNVAGALWWRMRQLARTDLWL